MINFKILCKINNKKITKYSNTCRVEYFVIRDNNNKIFIWDLLQFLSRNEENNFVKYNIQFYTVMVQNIVPVKKI